MSFLLKDATLITLDPPALESGDLYVDGGHIKSRGTGLDTPDDAELVRLHGKVVVPGMVCAHTHLYSTLARGMPPPQRSPATFVEILELVWWRLDRALDDETIYWSALAGALDAARAGTTCVFDHHSSPSCIAGSLQIVREAIEKAGLRGVLCYEVTDRGGEAERDNGIIENAAFLEWASSRSSRFRGMVGAHASFTLSDRSLEDCSELMAAFDAGLHVHVAEDRFDVEHARARYGGGVVERLVEHRAVNERTILAHGVHLDDRDIQLARDASAWLAHNPRSNLNNRVGYAPVAKFDSRLVLGTDGIGADLFEEGRFAYFKSQEQRTGLTAEDWIRSLGRNQRLASQAFGVDLGSLRPGSAADLAILDYDPPTLITAENLAWHFMFGLTSAAVEAVMVGGEFIVRDRRSVIDDDEVARKSRKASEKLWAKLG